MKLTIATPIYGTVEAESAYAFAAALVTLVMRGHEVEWDIEKMDPQQPRARSTLLHRFAKSDADALVCIDKDSVFTADDIESLLAIDVDVAVPVIVKKALPIEVVGAPLGDPIGEMQPMRSIGFGMVVLSRRCVERMIAHRAQHVFVHHSGASSGERIVEVFRTRVRDERSQGVDEVFSDDWRELRGELWRHNGVRIGHIGSNVFQVTS